MTAAGMPVVHDARLVQWITLSLTVWLVICTLVQGLSHIPSPDDAMFLSVPKNWLNGYGWATSYSEKIPFNPDFTAGPTVLLPAALLIWIFGNTWWIAGLTGALLNLGLLGIALWRIHHTWPKGEMYALALITAAFVIRPDDISNLSGYYTAALLILLMTILGYDETLPLSRRAWLVGLLGALALHTKPLALPAVIFVTTLFVWHGCCLTRQQRLPLHTLVSLFARVGTPLLVLLGGWALWRTSVLTSYPETYQEAWRAYSHAFFLQHGSGLHQWLNAQDKLQYVLGNIDRNLFHIEQALAQSHIRNPFLGDAPADVRHVIGFIWLGLTALVTLGSLWQLLKKPTNAPARILFVLGACSVLYFGWFLGFAMALSAGHALFPLQWSAWILLMATVSCLDAHLRHGHAVKLMLLLCAMIIMNLIPTHARPALLLQTDPLQSPASQLDALQFLQQVRVDFPLAGCGYSAYPRHLEYLLPESQNFLDCYDLIEDHAILDTDAYYRDNALDPALHPDAMRHFRENMARDKSLQAHFHWRDAPLNFTLVLSLQSFGHAIRFAPILQACLPNVHYRNQNMLVLSCRDVDLRHAIDLDFMMREIIINQGWYRTRLKP